MDDTMDGDAPLVLNGRPWFYRLEYIDGSTPADTDLWVYMDSGINYRRAYYASKNIARPFHFKAWYRFSLEEE